MKTCPACAYQNPEDAKTCGSYGYEFDSSVGGDETKIFDGKISGFSAGDMIAGRYRVVRELGRGGMGVVYLVSDTRLQDRQVALKMIHPQLVTHPEAQKRFEQEVSVCLDLLYPNIVRVHNLEEIDGLPFFRMDGDIPYSTYSNRETHYESTRLIL
jgi:serine/threonine protein kinase